MKRVILAIVLVASVTSEPTNPRHLPSTTRQAKEDQTHPVEKFIRGDDRESGSSGQLTNVASNLLDTQKKPTIPVIIENIPGTVRYYEENYVTPSHQEAIYSNIELKKLVPKQKFVPGKLGAQNEGNLEEDFKFLNTQTQKDLVTTKFSADKEERTILRGKHDFGSFGKEAEASSNNHKRRPTILRGRYRNSTRNNARYYNKVDHQNPVQELQESLVKFTYTPIKGESYGNHAGGLDFGNIPITVENLPPTTINIQDSSPIGHENAIPPVGHLNFGGFIPSPIGAGSTLAHDGLIIGKTNINSNAVINNPGDEEGLRFNTIPTNEEVYYSKPRYLNLHPKIYPKSIYYKQANNFLASFGQNGAAVTHGSATHQPFNEIKSDQIGGLQYPPFRGNINIVPSSKDDHVLSSPGSSDEVNDVFSSNGNYNDFTTASRGHLFTKQPQQSRGTIPTISGLGQEINLEAAIREPEEVSSSEVNYTIPIINYESKNDDVGSYGYRYATGNGISAQEQGYQRNDGTKLVAEVRGSYTYTGPDGVQYTVTYIANENGFQPQGTHLPTPPPIPEEIRKNLEETETLKANSNYEEAPSPTGVGNEYLFPGY